MSLNSTSVIKIVDLLCEGPIEEIVGGEKGIFLNDTAFDPIAELKKFTASLLTPTIRSAIARNPRANTKNK